MEGIGSQTGEWALDWEDHLLKAQALKEDTISCRLQLDRADRLALVDIDRQQAAWVADAPRRVEEARWEKHGGRVSGPEEWRKARAEMGSSSDNPKPKVTGRLTSVRISTVVNGSLATSRSALFRRCEV